MLGLSLSKIVLTLAIVAGVWWLWRRLAGRTPVGQRAPAAEGRRNAPAKRNAVEEMIACPICGTFVAAHGAPRCARDDCPY